MEPSFDQLVQLGLEQELTGWDWTWFEARTTVEPLPWDYESLARERVARAHAVLDIDTGGGEVFSRLGPYPMVAWATEGYPPNISLARKRLEPLGIQVADVSEIDGLLPFVDDTFDLVINRHGGHHPFELVRIMQQGGIFLTQQVGGANYIELNHALQKDVSFIYSHCTLPYNINKFKDAGLQIITAQEAFPKRILYDIASVVFYLKVIPWQIKDFTVDNYRDGLLRIHNEIRQTGSFTVHEHRILIEAVKPF